MPDNTESESLDFIQSIADKHTSHVIRYNKEVSGVVKIQVLESENYNLRVCKGTEDEPQIIKEVSKDKLVELIEQRL